MTARGPPTAAAERTAVRSAMLPSSSSSSSSSEANGSIAPAGANMPRRSVIAKGRTLETTTSNGTAIAPCAVASSTVLTIARGPRGNVGAPRAPGRRGPQVLGDAHSRGQVPDDGQDLVVEAVHGSCFTSGGAGPRGQFQVRPVGRAIQWLFTSPAQHRCLWFTPTLQAHELMRAAPVSRSKCKMTAKTRVKTPVVSPAPPTSPSAVTKINYFPGTRSTSAFPHPIREQPLTHARSCRMILRRPTHWSQSDPTVK